MAFNDWDGDGKNTFADDYIEYQIYKETMDENDDNFAPRKKNNNHISDNPKYITTAFSDDSKKDYSDPPSANGSLIASIIVCVLCFGGIALCVSSNTGAFGKLAILAGAVGLSVFVLKAFGVMR